MSQLALLGHRMVAKERTVRMIQSEAKRFWTIEFFERMGRGPVTTKDASSSSLFRPNLPLDWSTIGARHWPAIIINVSDTGINCTVLILDLGVIARLVPDKGKIMNNQLKLGDKLFCRIFRTSRDKSLLWVVEADGSACDDGQDLERLAVF
jgi:hypothetical protein